MQSTKQPSGRMLDLAKIVDRLTRSEGYAPTLREVAQELETGLTRAQHLAHAARDRGLITFKDRAPRTIRVVDTAAIRMKRPAKA